MPSLAHGIIALFLFLLADTEPGYHRKDLGLRGNLKAYREKSFFAEKGKNGLVTGEPFQGQSQVAALFNPKGRIIAEKTFTDQGEMEYREEFSWNEKGKIQGSVRWDEEGEILQKLTFKYDELGRMTDQKVVDANDKVISRKAFTFDMMGRKVREATFDQNGMRTSATEFSFGKDSKSYEEYVYEGENLLKSSSKCNLGANGKLAERIINDPRGWLMEKIEYQYDTEDRLVRLKKYNSDGELTFKWVKTFDEFGNVTDYKTYHKGLYLQSELTTDFEYDENGNWTRKTEFKNKIPHKITVRDYFYFD
ncbi:MAG: hypothetical protein H6581_22450 [Bacteroidia bacterium]|nr:hypothetical protein [Bacteroidia bacterium]